MHVFPWGRDCCYPGLREEGAAVRGDRRVTKLLSGGAGMQTRVSLRPEPGPLQLSAALLEASARP